MRILRVWFSYMTIKDWCKISDTIYVGHFWIDGIAHFLASVCKRSINLSLQSTLFIDFFCENVPFPISKFPPSFCVVTILRVLIDQYLLWHRQILMLGPDKKVVKVGVWVTLFHCIRWSVQWSKARSQPSFFSWHKTMESFTRKKKHLCFRLIFL